MAAHNEGINQGVMMYPGTGCDGGKRGDNLIFAPPYTTTPEEIDLIVTAAVKTVDITFERILKATN
jgi:adenosylmethionine-8-amino-7-oxononanoate aminotransferase